MSDETVPAVISDVESGIVHDEQSAARPDSARSAKEIHAEMYRQGDTRGESAVDVMLDRMEELFAGADTHEQRRAVSDRMYTDADGVLQTRHGRFHVVDGSGSGTDSGN